MPGETAGGNRRDVMDRPRSDLFDDPTDTVEGELIHDFTLVRRGYDPEEVNDHLRQLSVRTDALERQLRDAEAQLSAMRRGNDDVWKSAYRTAKEELYGRFAARLSEVLKTADRIAEDTRNEAEETARASVEAARAEAEQATVKARQESADLRRDAEEARDRAEAERETILSDLTTRRDSLITEVRDAADRLSNAVGRLYELLPTEPAAAPPLAAGESLLEVPDLSDVIDLGEGPEQG
jgi:DivIVA domain-containing protein